MSDLERTEQEWREALSPEQFAVLREAATETPFTGRYDRYFEEGSYRCAGCGRFLFRSAEKFDSGCGWPAYSMPFHENAVTEHADDSAGMHRTEIRCAGCGGHLGHLFDDGPPPNGKRYCINSVALRFEEPESTAGRLERATFGGGCFWGTEWVFRKVDGVIDTAVGFMGGSTDEPTYEQVCTGGTGHAEVIDLLFNPEVVTFEQLLAVFFENHDPTTLNRQGPDVGTQYRSAVFSHGEEQAQAARAFIEVATKEGRFSRPIVTEVVASAPFWRAEEYHQRYFEKRGESPSCQLH